MIQVNTNEAKARLSHLLSRVEKDHEKVKICRNGRPIALLVHIDAPTDPLQQHHKLMGVKIHEDPTAPLDEEDWLCDLK